MQVRWAATSGSYERRERDETANLYRIGGFCDVGSPGDDTRSGAELTEQ